MKNILVTTDFSEDSINAALYAAHLAKEYNARLFILHVFSMPLPSSNQIAPNNIINNADEEELAKALKKIEGKLSGEVGTGLKICCEGANGYTKDKIDQYCVENDIDLIVTGTEQENEVLDYLLESTSSGLSGDQDISILAVPSECKYSKEKSIPMFQILNL
jgi:nucleotide-binding universal stress UspA family protein